MLSGTVYSNINGSELGGQGIACNINTTQLFNYETSNDGSFNYFCRVRLFTTINAKSFRITDPYQFYQDNHLKDFYLDQVIEYGESQE